MACEVIEGLGVGVCVGGAVLVRLGDWAITVAVDSWVDVGLGVVVITGAWVAISRVTDGSEVAVWVGDKVDVIEGVEVGVSVGNKVGVGLGIEVAGA